MSMARLTWPARLAPLTAPDVLRVKFKPHGADLDGWDCVGCARVLTRTAFGVDVSGFDADYEGTDWRDAQTLSAAIARHVGRFTPCAPGFGAWLLLKRFGVICHVGFGLDARTFVHAEDAGPVRGALRIVPGGGTYLGSLDEERAKGRFVGAFRPEGVAC